MSDGLKYSYVIDETSPFPDDHLVNDFFSALDLDDWNYTELEKSIVLKFRHRKHYEGFVTLITRLKGPLN